MRNVGDEYRLHMSWVVVLRAAARGQRSRTMTDEIKDILMNAEVIAINQDKAVNRRRNFPRRKVQLRWQTRLPTDRLRGHSIARTIPPRFR